MVNALEKENLNLLRVEQLSKATQLGLPNKKTFGYKYSKTKIINLNPDQKRGLQNLNPAQVLLLKSIYKDSDDYFESLINS